MSQAEVSHQAVQLQRALVLDVGTDLPHQQDVDVSTSWRSCFGHHLLHKPHDLLNHRLFEINIRLAYQGPNDVRHGLIVVTYYAAQTLPALLLDLHSQSSCSLCLSRGKYTKQNALHQIGVVDLISRHILQQAIDDLNIACSLSSSTTCSPTSCQDVLILNIVLVHANLQICGQVEVFTVTELKLGGMLLLFG